MTPNRDANVVRHTQSNRVSVLICTRNYARYLGACLESVLAQTRTADEIVVVDDGSSDDTAEVVKRFNNIKYVWQNNAGKTAAFNRGFAECTGDVICHLDADDVWRRRKLDAVVSPLVASDLGGIVHEVYSIDADGVRIRGGRRRIFKVRQMTTLSFREILLSLFVYPPFAPERKRFGMPNTLVVRRDAIADAIPLPTCLGLSVDIALLLLGARKGISYLPRKLGGYRWHGANYYLANRRKGIDEMMQLLTWIEGVCSVPRIEVGILRALRAEWEACRAMRTGSDWIAAAKALRIPVRMMNAGIIPSWKHWALPVGCLVGRARYNQ